MGQYFKVVNRHRRQYLEPFQLRSSERFPGLMHSSDMTQSIAWLVCTSENPNWTRAKNLSDRTQRLIGSWAGDTIALIGDVDEESEARLVDETFENISLEMLAVLMETSGDFLDEIIDDAKRDPETRSILAKIAVLPSPPSLFLVKWNANILD